MILIDYDCFDYHDYNIYDILVIILIKKIMVQTFISAPSGYVVLVLPLLLCWCVPIARHAIAKTR